MGSPLVNKMRALRKRYGSAAFSEPRTAFALIVWENCAYLVDDERRLQTFERLSAKVGVTPVALMKAGAKRIQAAIEGGGLQSAHRAAKVLSCAEIAMEAADGDLDAALLLLAARPRRALLKRFPGIADPGVDRVLLLCGLSVDPTVDSNGLRVLERWEVIASGQPYALAYRAAVADLAGHGVTGEAALEAYGLLRAHGRALCKRNAPRCDHCPVRSSCPYP
jgi:endonuclease III